jgi:hypothetical protein
VPREPAELRLIRETLEGVVHPATASTLLFEALAEHGGVLPSDHEEIEAFVRGELSKGLVKRLGDDLATTVLDQIAAAMRAIPDNARRRNRRQEDQTRDLVLRRDTFPVFVLASSPMFAKQLAAALGPKVMTVVLATDTTTWHERAASVAPAFVIVDAADFPAIEPDELVATLASQPADVVKAIWGSDLPYGMSVIGAASARALSLTPFDRHEGIAPLMDMIRSRRA